MRPRLISAVTGGTPIKLAELDPPGMAIPQCPGFYPALTEELANRGAEGISGGRRTSPA
ncbi:hypothetical protein ATI53_104130 [Salipiger aestuarii]|uniref:Uncharacterized protein n=1 Tax=Salipiger aestuarii TaxID=568098 RepID=A0A327XXY0_9RHOB|nr:hypothetical protein ATI53_104130 [Salipiger aestuarii]